MGMVAAIIGVFLALMVCMIALQICWALVKWLVKLLYRFVMWYRHRNACFWLCFGRAYFFCAEIAFFCPFKGRGV